MATIRTCDWTKKRLAPNEETFRVVVDGKTYEVSREGLQQLRARLDSDELPLPGLQFPPGVRAIPSRDVPAQAAAPAVVPDTPVEDLGINMQAPDPFAGKPEPGLLDAQAVQPLPIPDSIKTPLPKPTPAQAEAVIAESTKFQEGTLASLSKGHRNRKIAQERLAVWENSFEDTKRKVPDRIGGGD